MPSIDPFLFVERACGTPKVFFHAYSWAATEAVTGTDD
jgi:hypothetical protein